MKKSGLAVFVDYPRILSDLQKDQLSGYEQRYEIVKSVTLGKMDYDNFCTDMVADRMFIEDYANLCNTGAVWKCLFVHQRGRKDGILVIPTEGCHVGYAAYLPGEE